MNELFPIHVAQPDMTFSFSTIRDSLEDHNALRERDIRFNRK